ncbi:hypothetical protein HMSSN036_44100 [Paenibacillus macerans]|nr:hypothetical protein HMSSN036_44100 [Paenibacillus macerans]
MQIGGKYKKEGKCLILKDNLDTVIKNAPKFDTYLKRNYTEWIIAEWIIEKSMRMPVKTY